MPAKHRAPATAVCLGPGFFLRGHDDTQYAWADVFFGKDRDAMLVIRHRIARRSRTMSLGYAQVIASDKAGGMAIAHHAAPRGH